jgi:hypothetical protein
MADVRLERFLRQLHEDRELRERFARHPAAVLSEAGFDPDLLDLPSRIDVERLEQRLQEIHRGTTERELPRGEDTAGLTADELWERFQFIRLKPDAVAGVTMPNVLYGTTPVLVVGNAPGATLRSFEQIRQLREMSRMAPERLTFSVSGPDGVTVSDLTADTMQAFLGRLTDR